MPIATRLAIIDDDLHQLATKGHSYWRQLPSERHGFKLFGVGQDAKTKKGDALGIDTAISYHAPATNATPKGQTLCPNAATAKCHKACLFTAGRGRMSSVFMSRIYKTLLFLQMRPLYDQMMIDEINSLNAKANRNGRKLAVRPNGTSDSDFSNIIKSTPQIQYYDYTKQIDRLLANNLDNYHLTASYSGANPEYASTVLSAVDAGYNAATVFRSREQSKHAIQNGWRGYEVIDGDEHDARFLDKRAKAGKAGYIVALYAKGQAKRDRTGFVVDL